MILLLQGWDVFHSVLSHYEVPYINIGDRGTNKTPQMQLFAFVPLVHYVSECA